MALILALIVNDARQPTLQQLLDAANAARARTGDLPLTAEQFVQRYIDQDWLDREAREASDREATRVASLYLKASTEDRAAIDEILVK
jgi:hypothetical protein